LKHTLPTLVGACGLDPHDPVSAAGVLLLTHDLRYRAQRVARVHRPQEAHASVAQVRHGVERDIVDRLPKYRMESEQVIDRLPLVAQAPSELRRTMQRIAISSEPDVERLVALSHGAGHSVHQRRARLKVLKEIAGVSLRHDGSPGC